MSSYVQVQDLPNESSYLHHNLQHWPLQVVDFRIKLNQGTLEILHFSIIILGQHHHYYLFK